MAATKFVTLLLQSLILFVVKVHEELDEDTRDSMQEREMELNQEMTQLMEEMERRSQLHWNLVIVGLPQRLEEHGNPAWEAVLFAVIAAGIVLLFWLCRWLRKRTPKANSVCGMYETSDRSADEEDEEESDEGLEELKQGLGISAKHIEWPVQKILSRSQMVKQLMDDLLQIMQEKLSNSFFPVLQPAIGVGSTFEGWSPREADDVIYYLLVPLKPPAWHAFHLEEFSKGPIPAQDYWIRVDVECSCREQNALCFIHHSWKQLKRRKQVSGILNSLCTGSYLDVRKVVEWFQDLVKEAWVALPQAHHYKMKVLPYSQRFCLLNLESVSGSSLILQIFFGVQQGDSDIFLSSQNERDATTPSVVWTNSYLVAEEKFFRHMTRQVPHGTFHLKCLHVCTSILEGTDITPYIFKTVVMHLLNTKPVSAWCKRECIILLADILRYLHCCLEQKRLDFFFFGNAAMPQEIILPSDFLISKPHNLLQHLVKSPAAHAEALRQFEEIQEELMNRMYKEELI